MKEITDFELYKELLLRKTNLSEARAAGWAAIWIENDERGTFDSDEISIGYDITSFPVGEKNGIPVFRAMTADRTIQGIDVGSDKKTYLMLDEITGYYKIGRSANPEFRERTLQAQRPVIKLIHTIESDVEKYLHKKFKTKRVRGEWFALTSSDIEFIKLLQI